MGPKPSTARWMGRERLGRVVQHQLVINWPCPRQPKAGSRSQRAASYGLIPAPQGHGLEGDDLAVLTPQCLAQRSPSQGGIHPRRNPLGTKAAAFGHHHLKPCTTAQHRSRGKEVIQEIRPVPQPGRAHGAAGPGATSVLPGRGVIWVASTQPQEVGFV